MVALKDLMESSYECDTTRGKTTMTVYGLSQYLSLWLIEFISHETRPKEWGPSRTSGTATL
jgi:hypothetical protein